MTKLKDKALLDLEKEKDVALSERKEKDKLSDEIGKIRETLEKYQNIVLNKAMENNTAEALSLLKQNSNQSRIIEKPIY